MGVKWWPLLTPQQHFINPECLVMMLINITQVLRMGDNEVLI